MKSMRSIRKTSCDQFMHKHSGKYRKGVRRKIDAYHRFIQIGLIAQGLLQYLSISFHNLVWAKFATYLRTIRPGVLPSEHVTSLALRNCFPDFLSGSLHNTIFTKFLIKRMDSISLRLYDWLLRCWLLRLTSMREIGTLKL